MKTLDNVSGGLAVVSGLVLVALIGLTFADVVLRYVFAAPILGAKDLLEMGMVTVVALAFPFTWRIGGHIVVDLIPEYGIGALDRGRDISVRAIGFFVFAVLAWRAWLRADDAALFNEATNMIEVPFQPFFWLLAAAAAFQALVLAAEIGLAATGRPLGYRAAWAAAETDGA
ncbi:MAG: TRAP transporter small permease [Defluviicoccus sp.]|nr:TRAP transporter small permease [Defluviicoccus sp.]